MVELLAPFYAVFVLALFISGFWNPRYFIYSAGVSIFYSSIAYLKGETLESLIDFWVLALAI